MEIDCRHIRGSQTAEVYVHIYMKRHAVSIRFLRNGFMEAHTHTRKASSVRVPVCTTNRGRHSDKTLMYTSRWQYGSGCGGMYGGVYVGV